MSILTPTTTGNVVAGVVVGAFQWSLLAECDKIPILRKFMTTERKWKINHWIAHNRLLAFLLGEAGNMGIHQGITDPNGAMFALGNTAVNLPVIFVVCPWLDRMHRKDEKRNILEGV
jgi:hypothetical protein